jgi:hypothetical protein
MDSINEQLSINGQLKEVYASNWEVMSEALSNIVNAEITIEDINPLLLCLDRDEEKEAEEEWVKADFRVMIFGTETNNWVKKETKPWQAYHDSTILSLLDKYNVFFNGEECQSYGGYFWNGFYRFKDMLNNKYPDKKICYLWNNIVKIGKKEAKGCSKSNVREIERKYFHVIPDEIRILQPNVLLFLTGPDYDDCISENFGETVFSPVQPYSESQLAKLSIPDVDFAFRTYHPHYLWKHKIDDYFNATVNQI